VEVDQVKGDRLPPDGATLLDQPYQRVVEVDQAKTERSAASAGGFGVRA